MRLTVYPGFIDLFATAGQRRRGRRSATGRGRPVDLAEVAAGRDPARQSPGLTPEFEAAWCSSSPTAPRARRRSGYQLALGAGWRDRDRPERPGQPERPAPA